MARPVYIFTVLPILTLQPCHNLVLRYLNYLFLGEDITLAYYIDDLMLLDLVTKESNYSRLIGKTFMCQKEINLTKSQGLLPQ